MFVNIDYISLNKMKMNFYSLSDGEFGVLHEASQLGYGHKYIFLNRNECIIYLQYTFFFQFFFQLDSTE